MGDAGEAEYTEEEQFQLDELKAFLGLGLDDASAPAAAPLPPGPLPPGLLEPAAGDIPLPPGFESGPGGRGGATGSSHGAGGGGDAEPKARPSPEAADVAGSPGRTGLEGEAGSRVIIQRAGEDLMEDYLAETGWEDLGLPKEILDGVYDLGFVKPSKIQEAALPIAVRGENLIGQARNGSGKTAAFALAMLARADLSWDCMSAVCVCPTRELAVQTHGVLERLGKHTGAKFFLAIPQAERVPRQVKAQLVVGTPGKLQDLLKRRVLDGQWCKVFVVDEADTMIDEQNQMGPQVMQIRALLPEEMQVLLFSATFPPHVDKFAEGLTRNSGTRIRVEKEALTLDTITQTYIDVGTNDRKFQRLSELYAALNVGQSVVFVNSRQRAFELAKLMKAEGHSVSLICGTQKTGEERMDEHERDRVMQEFRSGVTKVLVATDVLSRGIDVPAVLLVVNYDLPSTYRRNQVDMEVYQHRIGRTGRFGLRGIAVNLVAGTDVAKLDSIRSFYRCKIDQLSGDVEEMEDLLKSLR